MANSAYLLGSTVRLSVTFTVSDTPTDPTTVTLQVGDAMGSPSTYTWAGNDITRTSAGAFYMDFVPDSAGSWTALWTGAGDVDATEEQTFDVVASSHPWATTNYPNTYASLPQLRAALRLDSTDDVDETEMLACLQAASREIDGEVARRSGGTVTDFIDVAVPAPISRATVILAIAIYKRSEAPFGVLASSLDGTPIQVGKDFHVDALITSVVPWALTAL